MSKIKQFLDSPVQISCDVRELIFIIGAISIVVAIITATVIGIINL